jgi:dienelactone hydrolase
VTLHFIARGAPPSGLARDASANALRDAERHQRAMPLTRLLGNGMEHSDAARLHRLAADGYAWHEAGEWLGDRDVALADEALRSGRRLTGRSWLRRAVKRALYAKLVATFGRAMTLEEPPGERVEVAFRGSYLCAWLLRPARSERVPVVIVIGGADGWREEYQEGARHLVERGVAVLLAELPGQGETRLMRGLYLARDVDRAVGAIVDALHAHPALAPRVGIWGNSMGGSFAAFAASREPRLAACCVNAGSATPAEVIERFPAILDKLRAMVGPEAGIDAQALIESLGVTGADNRIRCPLLVLHGEPDRIFLVENARRLYEEAPAEDKQMHVWDDGEHCLYNHSEMKHCLVADWFASRLGQGTAAVGA